MRKSISKRIRLIKSHRLYSSKELAKELGVHQRTVQQWQKQGMKPVDSECKPFLFRGENSKFFLSNRRKDRKQKLGDGEFYCTKCRRPVKSITKNISWNKLGSERLIVRGICEKCGTSLNRFSSKDRFQPSVFGVKAGKADMRLYESRPANVNTDLVKETNNE